MPLPCLRSATPSVVCLLAGGLIAALAACTGQLNRGTGPLGTTLPDLEAPTANVADGSPSESTEGWRFSEVDRGSWELVVIAAPRGQVETNPTPDFTPTVMAGRDVDSAAMPTAETAVIVASDGGRVALDGLADPFRAAWSLIESPYGLVVRPPWSAVLGPLPARYEVLPQTASAAQAEPAIEEPALGE
jgi:hypothetical protein